MHEHVVGPVVREAFVQVPGKIPKDVKCGRDVQRAGRLHVLREVRNPPRNVRVCAAQSHQIADTTAIVENAAVGGVAIPRHESVRTGLERHGFDAFTNKVILFHELVRKFRLV